MHQTDDLAYSYGPETAERTWIVHATLNAHAKPPWKMRHKGYLHKWRRLLVWSTCETLIWEDKNQMNACEGRANYDYELEWAIRRRMFVQLICVDGGNSKNVSWARESSVLFYTFASGRRRCGMWIQKYNTYMHVSFSTVSGILHRCLVSWPMPDKLGATMMFSLLLCLWVRVMYGVRLWGVLSRYKKTMDVQTGVWRTDTDIYLLGESGKKEAENGWERNDMYGGRCKNKRDRFEDARGAEWMSSGVGLDELVRLNPTSSLLPRLSENIPVECRSEKEWRDSRSGCMQVHHANEGSNWQWREKNSFSPLEPPLSFHWLYRKNYHGRKEWRHGLLNSLAPPLFLVDR